MGFAGLKKDEDRASVILIPKPKQSTVLNHFTLIFPNNIIKHFFAREVYLVLVARLLIALPSNNFS